MGTSWLRTFIVGWAALTSLPATAGTPGDGVPSPPTPPRAPPATALEPGARAPALQVTWDGAAPATGRWWAVRFEPAGCDPCALQRPALELLAGLWADRLDVAVVTLPAGEPAAEEEVGRPATTASPPPGAGRVLTGAANGTDVERAWIERSGGAAGMAALVAPDGTVAWLGWPGDLGEAVAGLLTGRWTTDTARAAWRADRVSLLTDPWESALNNARGSKATLAILEDVARETPDLLPFLLDWRFHALRKDDARAAAELAAGAASDARALPDGVLNDIAWALVEPGTEFSGDLLAEARRMSQVSNDQTGWQDASLLDTWARVLWREGDLAGARAWQQRAVLLAHTEDRARLLSLTLAAYRADVLRQNLGGPSPSGERQRR